MADQRRVVVTGLGVISPIGNEVDTFWRRLVAGDSGVGEITRFDTTGYKVHIAAEVQGFAAADYIDKRRARRLDLFSQYAVAAAIDAAADAAFDPRPEAERVGAVMASGVGGLQTLHVETDKLLNQGPDRTNPLLVPMMIPNMGAAHVSLELGTKGPLSTTCTACAAASDAIGYAGRLIRHGDAEVMFAGGSEAPISPVGVSGFAAARALSTRNDDPHGASRPFDANRDGFVIGEGAGVLVLEELEHALARGARIYAELAGSGMSSDAFHMTLPDESGESQARAMLMALQEAGLDPSSVDYVNAHGTSTQMNDRSECAALRVVLGPHLERVAVSSTKSCMGHLIAAAGAVEGAVCALAIRDGVAPVNANYTTPDPECNVPLVVGASQSRRIRLAISNSLGFGGSNSCLAFRHPAEVPAS
jgi:3-oxoacyl-[acyl-carrier-protein] synthase II